MILIYVCLGWLAGGSVAALGHGGMWPAAVLAGFGVCASRVLQRRPGQAFMVGLVVLAGLMGLSRYEASSEAYPSPTVEGLVEVRGEIESTPRSNGETQSFYVRIDDVLESSDGQFAAVEGQRVRVSRRPYPEFDRGDEVVVRGEFQPISSIEADGFRGYLDRQGVVGSLAYPEVEVTGHRDGSFPTDWLASIRSELGSALEGSMPEPEAALAKGMLLGERDGIPSSVYAEFNDAGISHLIVISGANVMLVAGCVVGGLRSAVGRRQATLIAMTVVVVYALFVGGSPPVWRASAMAIVVLGGVLAGRGDFSRGVASPLQSYGLNALLLAAVVMTAIEPQVIGDVSFQLSFAATAGIVLFSGRFEERFDAALRRLPEGGARFLSSQLAMTTAASIAVLPIIAVYFDRLSLVSVAANLVAAPAFVCALGGSALAALAGLIDADLGLAVGAVGHLPMAFLVVLADAASGLPLASLDVEFSLAGAAVAYLLLTLSLFHMLRRRPRDPEETSVWRWRLHWAGIAAIATAALAVMVWWGALSPQSEYLRVTVLDVGQGDAILIETPDGHRVVVDGGPAGAALMQALGDVLPAGERHVDLVVLTHGQDDHVSGLVDLLRRYDVGHVLEGPLPGQTGAYAAWRAAVDAERVQEHRTIAGQRIDLGAAYIEVLAPDAIIAEGDPNENSVVLRLVYGNVSFLLTGDLGDIGEQSLLDAGFDLSSTVLKVGHHGSAGSTTTAFLEAVQPAVAVVSVGAGNAFGHPAPATRLRLGDLPLFRTDLNGSVRFESDGHSVWVSPQRGTFSTGVPLVAR